MSWQGLLFFLLEWSGGNLGRSRAPTGRGLPMQRLADFTLQLLDLQVCNPCL